MIPNPALSVPPVGEVSPSIADVSYRNYDGELRDRSARWWTIAQSTLRFGFKKLGFWIPAALCLLFYLITGLVFYFTRNVQQQFGSAGQTNTYAVALNQGLTGTSLLLFVAALTIGAGVIAADNKANALLVYLSKPITRIDYLVGKWMGVFLLLGAFALLPALLLYLFFLVAYSGEGFIKEEPTLILRVLAATLIPAALHTSLIMGFSAMSKSPRLAGSLYAAFYFVSLIVTVTAGELMQSRDKANVNARTTALVRHLSVDGVTSGLAEHLYKITPQQIAQSGGRARRRNRRPRTQEPVAAVTAQRPPLYPLLLIGGAMIALPIGIAAMRVRAVEVVRG